jgi:hypothetical protein
MFFDTDPIYPSHEVPSPTETVETIETASNEDIEASAITAPSDSGPEDEPTDLVPGVARAVGGAVVSEVVQPERPTEVIVKGEGLRTRYMFPGISESNVFWGYQAEDPALAQKYVTEIEEGLAERKDLPYALEATDEEKEITAKLNQAYCDLGDEVGVDVRNRVIDPRNVYVYKSVDDLNASYKEVSGDDQGPRFRGVTSDGTGMLWTRNSDPRKNTSGFAHEMGHHFDTKFIRRTLTPNGEIKHVAQSAYAFMARGQATGLSELSKEIMMANVMERAELGPHGVNYLPLDLLGDRLVRATAQFHGVAPYELEQLIIRNNLNGGFAAVRRMAEALGSNANAKALVGLNSHMGLDEARALVNQFELPDRDFQRIASGMKVRRPFLWKRG